MIGSALKFGGMVSALALVAVSQAAAQHKDEHKAPDIKEAVAVLVPSKDSQVKGVILLKQEHGYVQVSGEVTGLTKGLHGFHIHMFGDLRSPDGMSAGGHYNPDGHEHGKPDAKERHAGDLGNIEADDKGVAKVSVKSEGLNLHHVLGRGVVVHAKADDFSQPVGNAGARVAVGVIGIAEVKAPAAATKK